MSLVSPEIHKINFGSHSVISPTGWIFLLFGLHIEKPVFWQFSFVRPWNNFDQFIRNEDSALSCENI